MLTLTRNDLIFIALAIAFGITGYHLNWPPFRWFTGGPKRLNKHGKRAEGAFVLAVIEQAATGVSDPAKLNFAMHSSEEHEAEAA